MKSFDISKLQEIPISKEVLQLILSNAPSDAVLVGGQALVFWLEHFNIDANPDRVKYHFISRDVDFLGRREHVKALAKAISGVADYPSKKALTILCGQIFLVHKDDPKQFMNIDVIHRIGNMDSNAVRRRSVEGTILGNTFQVMHPLDVLVSRVENFRGIKDKQNEIGLRQVTLAIEVAKMYVFEAVQRDENIALKAIETIATTAKSAAGTYARKHGANIYDAIAPEHLARIIQNENFLSVRLPRLAFEINDTAKHPKGIYVGEIVSTENGTIIQDLGRNKLFEHREENLDHLINKGDKVKIIYNSLGQGKVKKMI